MSEVPEYMKFYTRVFRLWSTLNPGKSGKGVNLQVMVVKTREHNAAKDAAKGANAKPATPTGGSAQTNLAIAQGWDECSYDDWYAGQPGSGTGEILLTLGDIQDASEELFDRIVIRQEAGDGEAPRDATDALALLQAKADKTSEEMQLAHSRQSARASEAHAASMAELQAQLSLATRNVLPSSSETAPKSQTRLQSRLEPDQSLTRAHSRFKLRVPATQWARLSGSTSAAWRRRRRLLRERRAPCVTTT